MKSNDWRHKNVARYTPGNTKILYFFNCLLDGMHTIYLPEFCSLAAREISWRDSRKNTEVQECPTDTDLYLQKGYFL